MGTHAMTNEIASRYIRENFEPSDRLAVVLLSKRTNAVVQRLASAEQMTAPDFQQWLLDRNRNRLDVYISMNALHPAATGRTKRDVEIIRHVYLDFDVNGTEAVEALLRRSDVPKPNFRISSSPGKWQVVWKVEGFEKSGAEALQKGLARDTGADPAATDCARVLRLPGLHNHKYATPYLVGVETLATEVYRPDRFPVLVAEDYELQHRASHAKRAGAGISQSERDWAYAKRALARGDSRDSVIAAIASYRRYDKPNPQYYAKLTVYKAAEALRVETASDQPQRM